MSAQTRIAAAFTKIKAWMKENDAPLLVENLSPPATAAELADAERRLGFAVPPELKALWSVHHGQQEEQNGFVGRMDLLDGRGAAAEADGVKMFVDVLREDPDDWKAAGVRKDEIQSDAWIAFAGRGYADLLVVSGVSGRVFWCGKDAPTLQFRFKSITAWAEAYASSVEADDYEVVEGFGDYHLALRDRDQERRDAEAKKKEDAKAAYARDTPVLEQLKKAIAAKDEDMARDVCEAAAKAGQLDAGVALLFASKFDPAQLATSLQFVLNQVTLTARQWKAVAKGAESLGNNAIRDIAASRSRSP